MVRRCRSPYAARHRVVYKYSDKKWYRLFFCLALNMVASTIQLLLRSFPILILLSHPASCNNPITTDSSA